MDFDKIPVWAYGAGAVVIALALVHRSSGAAGATVTTVGPVANPNDAANLQARVSGFNTITGFAGKLVDQGTTFAQLNAGVTTAGIQAGSSATVAQINAETERARIAAAQSTAATQTASQLAAVRANGKNGVINNIVGTVGKVIGSIFKLKL